MTEDIRLKNISLFKKKLNEIGVDTSEWTEELDSKIANATFTMSNEDGLAYEGSLLHVVLRTLTPYAIKLNALLPEHIQVDVNSIIKVCLASHLGKCEMFTPNDNTWEVEKRGLVFKFNKTETALKLGMQSLIFAQQIGFTFTPIEIEAMVIMDRDPSDKQATFFSSPLANIIKQANELTFLTNKHLNNN